jgi:hypothetical protein
MHSRMEFKLEWHKEVIKWPPSTPEFQHFEHHSVWQVYLTLGTSIMIPARQIYTTGIPDIRHQRVNSSIVILARQEMYSTFAMERHTLRICVTRYYDKHLYVKIKHQVTLSASITMWFTCFFFIFVSPCAIIINYVSQSCSSTLLYAKGYSNFIKDY